MEITDFNAVTEPEVVAQETTEATVASESTATGGEESAKPRQSAQDNRAFASMRRELEKYKEQDAAQKRELSRLFSVLNAEGYSGTDASSIADAVEAAKEGITPDQIRSRRESREREVREAVQRDPEFIRNRQEAERFKELLFKRQIEGDIAEINKLYPDAAIKSAEDLGEEYRKLRANGISNEVAYLATVGKGKVAVKETVPEMGAVSGTKVTPEREFYTSDEIDRLTKKDMDDPKVWDKVLRSLSRLKK
ncbi:MAG: hypothetical protein IKY59_06470 [Oscillospiraceae bacterium]|nr:hypothetical protein [Oscillospiraceae bacterium]